ncbi:hypothetical protein [Pendulispora albinea]
MRSGIMADDLISAMRGAAPFARRGHAAALRLGIQADRRLHRV